MTKFRFAIALLALLCCTGMEAKKKFPVIRFEQETVDIGTFSQDDPVHKVQYKFRNVGDDKLIINYVHTSCGCTVADFPKNPISPGGSGVITLTYDATGKMPGKFRKSAQVFSNTKEEISRIFLTGNMTAMPKETVRKQSK